MCFNYPLLSTVQCWLSIAHGVQPCSQEDAIRVCTYGVHLCCPTALCMYVYVYVCVHICVCMYVYMYGCMYVCTYVWMYMCMCMCMCMYVYVRTYLCVYTT